MLQKYSRPVTEAATALKDHLDDIFVESKTNVIDYSEPELWHLSLLYRFGSFLGWIHILENNAISESIEFKDYEPDKSRQFISISKKSLSWNLAVLRSSFSSMWYFRDIRESDIPSSDIKKSAIPTIAIRAIGELMVLDSNGKIADRVISFIDFANKYRDCQEFKKWFSYIDNLLSELLQAEFNAKWNRLVMFYVYLEMFMIFMENRNNILVSLYWWLHDYINENFVSAILSKGEEKEKKIDFEYWKAAESVKDKKTDEKISYPEKRYAPLHPIVKKNLWLFVHNIFGYKSDKFNKFLELRTSKSLTSER